jgi:uncharacterized membrane protein
MSTAVSSYPADVAFAQSSDQRSRLTTFFRSILAIPVGIVLYAFSIAFGLTSLIAWFAILFTGRYPQGLYSFGVNYMRLLANVYAYTALVTDEYPPWTGSDPKAASYPIQYSITYPTASSRLKVFFRYFLGIPALVFAMIVGIAAYFATVVAWFAILITGRYPTGLLSFVEGTIRSLMRVTSYHYFMTDQYPPFSVS